MKKRFLTIAAITLTAGALIFTGCSKDDVTAPVVTINGSDVSIPLQGTYVELGATATDDKDGDLTSSITISGSVDEQNAKTYTITYSVTDAAGNVGEATRSVRVYNSAEDLAGVYTVGKVTEVEGGVTYVYKKNDTITASTKIDGLLTISRFGDYANNKVNITVNPKTNAITVIPITNKNVGTYKPEDPQCSVHDRETKSGTGTKTTTPLGFTLTYADANVSPAPCAAGRNNVVVTFIK